MGNSASTGTGNQLANRNSLSSPTFAQGEAPANHPPAYPRQRSQNEVKIEEYESENGSEKPSRSNSIRFVMLKDDVIFENPNTPELKAILKKKVGNNNQVSK